MPFLSYKKLPITIATVASAILLSGCGTTIKVGVPASYDGKLVKLKIKQIPSYLSGELEVLEIDGKAVENPSAVQFYPGEYVIKSQCKASNGVFTTTKSYRFKHGYKFELEAVEEEKPGTCRTRLMQYKTFVLQ